MENTPTTEDILDEMDFNSLNRDYQTTPEAVEEYGVPVVQAGGFEEDTETLITGRTIDNGMQLNEEEFEEARNDASRDLKERYSDAGLPKRKALVDFSAAFGVGLVSELDQDKVDEAAELAVEASGEELGHNYVNDVLKEAKKGHASVTEEVE